MDDPFRQYFTDVLHVLSNLRSSFDTSYANRGRISQEFDLVRRAYVMIEEMRFTLRAARNFASHMEIRDRTVSEIREGLDKFVETPELMVIADQIRYRKVQSNKEYATLDPELSSDHINVATAIYLLRNSVHEGPRQLVFDIIADQNERLLEPLRRMVPAQRVAPVKFEIRNSKISILEQPGGATGQDSSNAEMAYQQLQNSGLSIIDELKRSNCDPRLLQNAIELQAALDDKANIIKLGIANMSCEAMRVTFVAELPDAISTMIASHTIGLNMYVSQFPEWSRFVQNVASVKLSSKDVEQVVIAAKDLVAVLNSNPDVVSPEVPKVLEYLSSLIKTPAKTGVQTAFAVAVSIENLVISVYQYFTKMVEDTASKTSSLLSTAASKMIVGTLLAVAVSAALGIAPVTTKLAGGEWIKTVTEMITAEMKHIAAG